MLVHGLLFDEAVALPPPDFFREGLDVRFFLPQNRASRQVGPTIGGETRLLESLRLIFHFVNPYRRLFFNATDLLRLPGYRI